ncbi:hypothetical protein [Gracilimonas mengyeensis]|uniref:Bacteriocin-type signal sequence-containing protein n=1 Tax=Gracilimonas mengyeensis TaxID=1302730 RepID=A0A521FLV9_9BACT|nr:hypothetical protein [Gracilimonas mengyeensis]SMO97106.1 bacteriocin-type signal sequence-containing protein [Gracilimonas mengyeensis]
MKELSVNKMEKIEGGDVDPVCDVARNAHTLASIGLAAFMLGGPLAGGIMAGGAAGYYAVCELMD